MLKGCPQIYLSDVRHFSRRLLVVRFRTCHQTTYSCFCTQEFSWDSLPSARANRCCNNSLQCYSDNNFSYINYNYLPKIAIGGLLTTSALTTTTTTTSAFADGNTLSRVERLFAALLGRPVQTSPPAAYIQGQNRLVCSCLFVGEKRESRIIRTKLTLIDK